mmetsp:Transcript_12738/g.37849  ORF Transcript_12738/g.37849 Transcript_12738/m.37849 type:complete len:262 (+) Transcript_12738:603-1388(+)
MNLRMPASSFGAGALSARSVGRISLSATLCASSKAAMRASTSRRRSAFRLTTSSARSETTEVACRAPPTSPTNSCPTASWASRPLRTASVSLSSASVLWRRSSCASSDIIAAATPSSPTSPSGSFTTRRSSKRPSSSFRDFLRAGDGVPSSRDFDVRTSGIGSSLQSSMAKVTFRFVTLRMVDPMVDPGDGGLLVGRCAGDIGRGVPRPLSGLVSRWRRALEGDADLCGDSGMGTPTGTWETLLTIPRCRLGVFASSGADA